VPLGYVKTRPTSEDDAFRLEVETFNSGSWLDAKRHLLATSADVVFLQEHKLFEEKLAEASAWAIGKGWKTLFIPAVAGPAGCPSGGCAIAAREHFGLSYPPGKDSALVVAGRLAAALVEVPGCVFVGYAGYFRHGWANMCGSMVTLA
jgi:hypothetical protein